MESNCSVCRHKEVNEINRDMVLHAMSSRKAGEKYGINHNLINKHRPHITKSLALAMERRDIGAVDRLLEDTEMLWQETQKALELSKSSVKTMAITQGEGKKAKTVYKEYQDVGAILSAIKVAHDNRRLFGDATGAIRPQGTGGQVGIYLSIGMPSPEGQQPTINVTSQVIQDIVTQLPTNEEDPENYVNPEEIEPYVDPNIPKRKRDMAILKAKRLTKASIKAKIWGKDNINADH